MVLYYISGQAHLLWLFHIASIFWGVQFPFHHRKITKAGYVKYVHLAMVLTAVLLPVILAGVPFATGGYALPRFPPGSCHAEDTDTIYSVFMLPTAIIMPTGCTMMVFVLRAVVTYAKGNARLSRKKTTLQMVSECWK